MSWDAYLTCNCCGNADREWNYTHNTNWMANKALNIEKVPASPGAARYSESWWQRLNGMTGEEGAALLDEIITAFDADPDTYRAMNPSNGWGDFDSFRETLIEMRDASGPTMTWRTSG